jgi:hypothetical protein
MDPTVWKGLVFSLMLFLTCFFGTLVFLLPLLPLAYKWPSLGRRLMDFFLWLWFVLAAVSATLCHVYRSHPVSEKKYLPLT